MRRGPPRPAATGSGPALARGARRSGREERGTGRGRRTARPGARPRRPTPARRPARRATTCPPDPALAKPRKNTAWPPSPPQQRCSLIASQRSRGELVPSPRGNDSAAAAEAALPARSGPGPGGPLPRARQAGWQSWIPGEGRQRPMPQPGAVAAAGPGPARWQRSPARP